MDQGLATFIIFIVLWLIVIAIRSMFSGSKNSVLDNQSSYSMNREQKDNEPMVVSDERCNYCGSKYIDDNVCSSCGKHICHVCNKCGCK